MATIHRATITPTKLELIRSWVPRQAWCPAAGDDLDLDLVAAFRYDDPDGEVGIETHLVSAGEHVLQVPLTYRAAPAEMTEPALVGTTEHSVLGPRWVYDGCADPVYARALATSLVTGSGQAELWVEGADGPHLRRPSMTVTSTGTSPDAPLVTTVTSAADGATTVMLAGGLELVVVRVVDSPVREQSDRVLTATWAGHPQPALLALARAAH